MHSADETLDAYPGKDRARVAPVLSDVACRTDACEIELNISVFFDGTGNNWEWVEEGQMLTQRQRQKDSNVYRLFQAYPNKPLLGYFPIYVPGVGTPFKDIGEDKPRNVLGAGSGAGGDGRINFALLSVLNAIHSGLRGGKKNPPWLSGESIKALCRNGRRQYRGGGVAKPWPEGDAPVLARLGRAELGGLLRDPDDEPRITFLRQQCQRLAERIAATQKPKIKRIVLDVFGFSRGAAQARVFCTWLGELMPDGKLCGVPAQIRFLGLFDTVASVGVSGLGGGDGHYDWASAQNLRIGAHVKRCVHYAAMHEQRASFPLDTVRNPDGSFPRNCQQWMFPGMHSDVGGGYTPQEQGRGPDGRNDQKLSQIPLNRMYEAALQAQVPLDKKLAMEGPYDPFAIHPALQQAFDAFMTAAQADRPRRLREWLMPYLCWRYQQRYHYLHQPWSKRCPPEDKTVLAKANGEFIEDLDMFEPQRRQPDWFDPNDPDNQGITLSTAEDRPGLLGTVWSKVEKRTLASEAPDIFRSVRDAAPTPAALHVMFGDYVHDSMGAFTLPGMGQEYTGYLHYRRQFMGDDRALTRHEAPDDDRRHA